MLMDYAAWTEGMNLIWAEGIGLIVLTFIIGMSEWRRASLKRKMSRALVESETICLNLTSERDQAAQDVASLKEAMQLAQTVVQKLEGTKADSSDQIQSLESELEVTSPSLASQEPSLTGP